MSWSETLGMFLVIAGLMGLVALISVAAGRMAARDDEIDAARDGVAEEDD